MNLLEVYKYYQKGIVKLGTTEKLQRFFKTNPSEEQIMMLDEMEKVSDALMWAVVLLFFILGICMGWAVCYAQGVINSLMGV